MSSFDYEHNELVADGVPVKKLVKQYGTPLYIYAKKSIENQWRQFNKVLNGKNHLICYAVKANSNLAILQMLVNLGSGFDIVSQGELERVLMAGGDPHKIVFSGIGKSEKEIQRALSVGICCFNVESLPELMRINAVAKMMKKKAPIAFRVNPDVDAKTHPYISTGLKENKFGISCNVALEAYKIANSLSYIDVIGISFHIGSQLIELTPFLEATDRILALVDKLKEEGMALKHIDVGGGLGIGYNDETPPSIQCFLETVLKRLTAYPELKLILEPGRVMVADAGIMVTKIEYLKYHENQHFAIVDAGMNDLVRPALYGAWMRVIPICMYERDHNKHKYHIVGPVCESSDHLGKDRILNLISDDLIAVCNAGAYGFSMASQYNSRPKAAEILVDGNKSHLIRRRENYQDLWRGEQLLDNTDA